MIIMGRPRKRGTFSKSDQREIVKNLEKNMQHESVNNPNSLWGRMANKIFGKNTYNLRKKVRAKWFNEKNKTQKHAYPFKTSKTASKHGRKYAMPFWAKRQSYDIGYKRYIKTDKNQNISHMNKIGTTFDEQDEGEINKARLFDDDSNEEEITIESGYKQKTSEPKDTGKGNDFDKYERKHDGKPVKHHGKPVAGSDSENSNHDEEDRISQKTVRSDEIGTNRETEIDQDEKSDDIKYSQEHEDFESEEERKSSLFEGSRSEGETDKESSKYGFNEQMSNNNGYENSSKHGSTDDESRNKNIKGKARYEKESSQCGYSSDDLDKEKYLSDASDQYSKPKKQNAFKVNKGSEVEMKQFVIQLNYDEEWRIIKPRKGKRKLEAKWTNLFSSKFNDVIPGCVLAFKYHNVCIRKSSKGTYFNAKATCKHENCGIFKFVIESKPSKKNNFVEVQVYILRPVIEHKKGDVRKRQLRGKKRDTVKRKLENKTASTYYYEEFGDMKADEIDAGNYTKCQTKEVLRKARSEWNVRDVLHSCPFTELTIIKEILMNEDEESTQIKGYIQEIGYTPLSVVLYKEKSLETAKQAIKSGDGVFYLDATGTMVAKTEHSKAILYYAMVVKGVLKGNPPVPVLEFLSDNQGTYYIVRPLLAFFGALQRVSSVFSQPRRIETDFSWALIHSVLLACNKTSIENYLQLTYEIINGLKTDGTPIKTVIHICATHMLKAVRDALVETTKDKGERELLLRLFALFQNCTLIQQTVRIWKTMCVVFGSRYLSENVDTEIRTMESMIMQASLDGLEEELICHESPAEFEEVSKSKGIRASSPFNSFYKAYLSQSMNFEEVTTKKNPYYNLNAVELFVSKYLPLVSLWSGLMLGDLERHGNITMQKQNEQTSKSRDNNSAVENWMKIVKCDILRGKKRLRVGLFVRTLHPVLKGRLREYLCDISNLPKKTRPKTTPEKNAPEFAEESWRKKEKKSEQKSKHFYSPPKTFPKVKKVGKGVKDRKPRQTGNKSDNQKPRKTGMSEQNGSSRCPMGIRNTGNTCWIISTLQALSALKEITLSDSNDVTAETMAVITILQMSSGKRNALEIDSLKEAVERTIPSLPIGYMHDPAYFLHHIASKEHQFQAEVYSMLRCLRCQQEKSSKEMMGLLPTEIPCRENLTVNDCVKEFCKEELLFEENAVFCENCQDHTNHHKYFDIVGGSSPYLIIQLKRYAQVRTGRLSKKQMPILMNRLLSVGGSKQSIYRLAAVQVHLRKEETFFRTNFSEENDIATTVSERGTVLRCDDAKVVPKPATYLNSLEIQENAYILYYELIQIENPYKSESRNLEQPGEIMLVLDSLNLLPEAIAVAIHANIKVTLRDLTTLDPNKWLNDQIVNCYLKMIEKESDSVAVMDVFFFIDITSKKQCDKWLKQNPFRKEKVLIPICQNRHWNLVVLDMVSLCIKTMDSSTEPNKCALVIRNFLEKSELCPSGWIVQRTKGLPKQTNCFDCGIFMCQFAVCTALQTNIDFSQEDMKKFRAAMKIEIISGTLLPRNSL